MKTKIIRLILFFVLAFTLSGCDREKKPQESQKFSDRYLISTSYGGSGYGDFYECLEGTVTICTNGTVEVSMPELESDGRTQKGEVHVETLTLTEEQYNAIESAIDLEKLYYLDPKPDETACDGDSKYLTVYDEKNKVLKICGGYMPQNQEFLEMYRAVQENLPMEQLNAIREEWIENLKAEEKEEKEAMEYEFDEMMDFDQLDLYYEVHMAGMDGECFEYSVYFEDGLTDEKLEETNRAISEFEKPYNDKDIYIGYINVSKEEDKINIFLDLGNTDPDYEDTAINGILKALNQVSGIRSVIMNEDFDF